MHCRRPPTGAQEPLLPAAATDSARPRALTSEHRTSTFNTPLASKLVAEDATAASVETGVPPAASEWLVSYTTSKIAFLIRFPSE